MATTREDLIALVLQNLGVLAAGQPPSAEDRDAVNVRIDPKLAELGRREVMVGLSADALDPAVFLYVADILAAACRYAFGIAGTKADSLVAAAGEAEAILKGMARQFLAAAASAPFDVVQQVLETLGVVSPGQTPSAADRGVVQARVAPMLADLRDRDITTISALAEAQPAQLPHFATILTAICAPAFGATGPVRDQFGAAAGGAEQALNAMQRQFDTGIATGGTFDLIQVTLENLGAVAVGRTATAKDRSIIAGRVTAVVNDLRAREVIDIPTVAGAAPSVLLPLSVVLTSACAMAWGLPADVRQGLKVEALAAEEALHRQTRQLDAGTATAGTFDVVQAALEVLGVVAPGQSGTAKDRAVVQARIAPTLADLRTREVIAFQTLADVDPAAQIHLSAVLASACAQAFGVPTERRLVLRTEATSAEDAMRRLTRQFDAGSATSTVFDPIQVVLEVLGIVQAGQTASEKDRAVVMARVQPKLLELHGRDICGVTDLSLLSPELQGAFTRILAADCVMAFAEVPPARIAMLKAEVGPAEQVLRYQSFVYDARPPMRVESFWGRRRCGWPG